MEIIIKNPFGKFIRTISYEDLENKPENFKTISSFTGPLQAKIFVINEPITIYKLSKLKSNLKRINISSLTIYSNNRSTVVAGNSLKIVSKFVSERELQNKLLLIHSSSQDDISHNGTLRSGDRISSNGNLFIVGDVNPGAIVSARKNIYVWGKLMGIAFAGEGGNDNAFIAALYLKPLQLRISDVIAIGPKEKPKDNYPEIALLESQSIIIKPHIIEFKN